MYCRNCGSRLDDGQRFCADCGSQITASISKPHEDKPKRSGLDDGMLVWSIMGLAVIQSVFAIPALVMTILASVSSPEEASKRIAIAKKFNIAAIIHGAVSAIIVLVIGVCYVLLLALILSL